MSSKDVIFGAMVDAMELMQKGLREELKAQGHYLTGRLSESIDFRVFTKGSSVVVGEMYAVDYAMVLEVGVKPERIPYGGRTGRGGTSRYIQGLVDFFQLRGLGEREAMRAAFATANVQKQEGMPTANSYRFSNNGRRTGFVAETLKSHVDEAAKVLEAKTGFILNLQFPPGIVLEKIVLPT